MIYFIQEQSNEAPIKIGTAETHALKNRISSLQGGNPRKLAIIGFCEGGRAVEQELHKKFNRLRIRGEWFRCNERLLNFIKEVTPQDRAILYSIQSSSNEEKLVASEIKSSIKNVINDPFSILLRPPM